MKAAISGVMLFMIVLVGGGVRAEPPADAHAAWHDRLMEELQLTDDQKRELGGNGRGKGGQMRENLLAEREKLNAMLRDKSVPDAAVREQYRKVDDMERGWHAHRLEKMLRARNVLSAEQMKKLLDMKEEQRRCR